MDRKKEIEEAIEQTLQHFESAERLQSSPFFFTKLQARIEGLKRGANQRYRSAFGLLRFALLMLLLIWNVVTVTYLLGTDQSEAYERSEMISAFAEVYALELDD